MKVQDFLLLLFIVSIAHCIEITKKNLITRCKKAACPIDITGLKSLTFDKPVQATFINGLQKTVTVNWINYTGGLVFYAKIAPGNSYLISTFVTHPWVFRYDGSTTNIDLYQPTTALKQTYTIKDCKP